MNIRVLTKKDVKNYRTLRLYSFEESPYAFSESLADERKKSENYFADYISSDDNKFTLGAFSEENELIGFVTFKRDAREKARHKSMLLAMYVHPDFRQTGIGGKLVVEITERAKKLNGLEQIHLWALHSPNSISASNFYKKHGFISQGTMVKKDLKVNGIYVDAEYMVLYF